MNNTRPFSLARLYAPFMEMFGWSRTVAIAGVLFLSAVVLSAVFWFFHSAPPKTITITCGTPGSSFATNAAKLGAILASNGVTLKILPSGGSLDNLQRLEDLDSNVDIGFVESGISNGPNPLNLVSLGSVAYQPLLVFYKNSTPISLLSELDGKRLAVGPVGSGTRSLALSLLGLNGIKPGGETIFSDLDAEAAAKALLAGDVDAVFLMGDSAPPQLIRQLLLAPEIRLLDFTQADGYTRRFSYLNKLELPMGSIDFGKNIPSHDLYLLGPTVELIARPSLHPALSDLLLEAAQQVFGGSSLLKRRGEFPAPLEHDFPISTDAARYYKSGRSFLYRSLPFWLASVVNRMLVAFVPMIVVLLPAVRLIPNMYRWRIRLRIYRWYRALLALERDLFSPLTREKRDHLLVQLDGIEKAVNKMKVPASFADQFYGLRGHIDFVRDRLLQSGREPVPRNS